MSDVVNLRENYAELARFLKGSLGPDIGFAMWMRLADGHFHYASSARREDILEMLSEWIARAGTVNARDQGESVSHARNRVDLEIRCVKLGHMLESLEHASHRSTGLVLFLFSFGDRGSVAWYANVDARKVVETFLKVCAT